MKENVLDVLMYLFENYFYDELEDEPDRASMEENLHEAGFSNGEIGKAFKWLDGLAEQRFQPEFNMQTDQPIRIFVDFETTRIDTACLDFIMYLSNVGIVDAQRRIHSRRARTCPDLGRACPGPGHTDRRDGLARGYTGPRGRTPARANSRVHRFFGPSACSCDDEIGSRHLACRHSRDGDPRA